MATNNSNTNTALANLNQIRQMARSEDVLAQFSEVLGRYQASGYIASAMTTVASTPGLWDCTPQSVIESVMRAATLRLSCDPQMKQAWLVPFNNYRTGKKECTFQIGYMGYYQMALRTNKYRFINLPVIYEGMEVVEDPLSGMHTISGFRKGTNVLGYMLYFKMLNGFEKTFYMTNEEIIAYAKIRAPKQYADPKSAWNNANREDMFKKTVMKIGLRKWGYFDPNDVMGIERAEATEDNDQIIDVLPVEEPASQAPVIKVERSEEQIMEDLGFGTTAPSPKANGAQPAAQAPDVHQPGLPEDPFDGIPDPDALVEPDMQPADPDELLQVDSGQTLGEMTTDELKRMETWFLTRKKENGLKENQQKYLDAAQRLIAKRTAKKS